MEPHRCTRHKLHWAIRSIRFGYWIQKMLLCEHRGITACILPSVHLITVTPHFGLNRKFNWKLKDEFFVILQPKLKSKSRYDTWVIKG